MNCALHLQTYASVLKDFFEQLRSMADSLLLSREPLAVAAGSLLYKQMFQHFDSYFQQEVVDLLPLFPRQLSLIWYGSRWCCR